MNKQWLLNERPVGMPNEHTWRLEDNALPTLKDGQALLKTHYVSLDPAMRGWMNDAKSYIPPVAIGDVMRAGTVGEVIDSKNDDFKVGHYYTGWGGVQQYCLMEAGQGWYEVDPAIAPLQKYLGVLGMPGMTAYFGFMEVGQPKEGDTVVVSGAAGAVGSIVGQMAKIKGCTAIGIAGGKEKCDYLVNELGFDAAIDYKSENIKKALKEKCPNGIDVYFDNVGGEILDAVLTRLNRHARIPICGAISQYNSTEIKGPANYLSLLVNRARMEGFVVMDYAKDYRTAAMEMGGWMMHGKLKTAEHIDEGIENFRDTFSRLFSGDKRGKLLLKVDE